MEEITIESITSSVETPEALSTEQKTFLTDHAEELEDEVATKYGIEKPVKEIKPESRPNFDSPTPPPKDDDAEDDPEDVKRVNRIVAKTITPLQQQLRDSQDQLEVDTFIRDSATKIPDIGKYRSAMLTYMKDPAYAKIPAKNIFNIVAGGDLMKLGAKAEREAANKAGGTRVNSNSARPASGGGQGKDWGNVSKEEMAAKRAEVFGRPN